MWFAHRLNDWSKLAKERVKRATGDQGDTDTNLSDSKTCSTSSEDGSTQRDSQKSANSSFEVQSPFSLAEVHWSLPQECNAKNNSPQSTTVLQHQSKSFPPRHLQRTSSISSESSIENLHQVRWERWKKIEVFDELFTRRNRIVCSCFSLFTATWIVTADKVFRALSWRWPRC